MQGTVEAVHKSKFARAHVSVVPLDSSCTLHFHGDSMRASHLNLNDLLGCHDTCRRSAQTSVHTSALAFPLLTLRTLPALPHLQGPTDYERWQTSTSEYAVAYESEYEPYILCRRDIPPFDLRFMGYGGDKTSHIYELSRGGHVLVVLPAAFVVHEQHAPGEDL